MSTSQPTSPWRGSHHRNGRFFNPETPSHSFGVFLRWIRHRHRGAWRDFIPSSPGPKPPAVVDGSTLRVTFVNHSTFLLQTAGLNLLTDPVWSQRVSPVWFAGPKRHRNPGIRFEDLPQIDAILISHNHYDHFDAPTLRKLAARHRSTVFCPLGVAARLRRIGFQQIIELDWWQSALWSGFEMHCVPAQHFSARGPFDRNRALWCGWIVQSSSGPIYFAGDTGFGPFFEEIARDFPNPRAAVLPIGAYEPEWFMGPVHMTPEQALQAHVILGSNLSIASHYGTFALADDAETAPVERMAAALRASPPEKPFVTVPEGESVTLD